MISTTATAAFVLVSTSATTTATATATATAAADLSSASPTAMDSLCIMCHEQLSRFSFADISLVLRDKCPLPLPVRWAIFYVCFCGSRLHRLALDTKYRLAAVFRLLLL